MAEAAINLVPSDEKKAEPKPEVHAPAHEWWPFESFRREAERVMQELYSAPWRLPFMRAALDVEPAWRTEFGFGTVPAVDIVEKDDRYVITAEMPGVQASDITVGVSEGRLRIEGEKKEQTEEDRKGRQLSERRYGFFRRSFRVPDNVDSDKVEATFRDGVLTVTLQKLPQPASNEKIIPITQA
jgi:HSP20 family protein